MPFSFVELHYIWTLQYWHSAVKKKRTMTYAIWNSSLKKRKISSILFCRRRYKENQINFKVIKMKPRVPELPGLCNNVKTHLKSNNVEVPMDLIYASNLKMHPKTWFFWEWWIMYISYHRDCTDNAVHLSFPSITKLPTQLSLQSLRKSLLMESDPLLSGIASFLWFTPQQYHSREEVNITNKKIMCIYFCSILGILADNKSMLCVWYYYTF